MELVQDKSNIKPPESRKNVSHFQYNSSIKEITSHRRGKSGLKEHHFDTTTEIIANRIVKKELEFGKMGVSKRKSENFPEKPQIAVRMNNVVVQRILRIQMKESKEEKSVDMLHYRPDLTYTPSSSPTRTSSYQSICTTFSEAPNSMSSRQYFATPKTISRTSLSSVRSSKPSKTQAKKSFELPRFQLSSNCGTRTKVRNKGIQTNTLREFATSFCNQTDFEDFSNTMSVQVTSQPTLAGKRLQTRLYKKCDVETDPIPFQMPSKATNTNVCYTGTYIDHQTQLFEFMSDGDLFCLDWIDKYLFPINLNPFSVIVDRKLRDASELGTKSTLFSESKTLRDFHRVVENPCCEACS